MNNLALVTFLFFAFFLFFSNKSIIFVFIFNSPSVQHSKKPLDNYEKVLLFLHTTIIANYRNTSVWKTV